MYKFTIRIGSTPTFLHFDLYLYSAYAADYVYITSISLARSSPSLTQSSDLLKGIATKIQFDSNPLA